MKMTVWTRLSSSRGWMMEGLQRGWCLIMLHHHLRQKVKQIVEGPHHSYYLTLLCLFGGKIFFPPKWKFLVLCKIFKTFKNKNIVFVKTWKQVLLTSSSKHFVCFLYQICFELPTVLKFFKSQDCRSFWWKWISNSMPMALERSNIMPISSKNPKNDRFHLK